MSSHDEQHGEHPSRGVGFFSAPADAPRIRWRTDLISAGFFTAVLIFLLSQRALSVPIRWFALTGFGLFFVVAPAGQRTRLSSPDRGRAPEAP